MSAWFKTESCSQESPIIAPSRTTLHGHLLQNAPFCNRVFPVNGKRTWLSFQRNTQLTEKREKRIFGWHKDKVGGRKIATIESPGHPEARSQGAACGQQVPGCKVSWCSHSSRVAKLCSQTGIQQNWTSFKAISSRTVTLGCLHVLPQYHFLHLGNEVKIMPTSSRIWGAEEVNIHVLYLHSILPLKRRRMKWGLTYKWRWWCVWAGMERKYQYMGGWSLALSTTLFPELTVSLKYQIYSPSLNLTLTLSMTIWKAIS